MAITFEDVSATIDGPPPPGEARPQATPQTQDAELPQRLEQLLQQRAERLARLSAD